MKRRAKIKGGNHWLNCASYKMNTSLQQVSGKPLLLLHLCVLCYFMDSVTDLHEQALSTYFL